MRLDSLLPQLGPGSHAGGPLRCLSTAQAARERAQLPGWVRAQPCEPATSGSLILRSPVRVYTGLACRRNLRLPVPVSESLSDDRYRRYRPAYRYRP